MIAMDTKQRAASTLWRVDPDLTVVDFAVKTFWGLITVRGRFDRFDGWYEVGPDGASIELTIDARSVNTGNRTRDRHLRSADFFNVAEYPLVRFTSTRVRHTGDGTLRVEGNLEAAGTAIPLQFDASMEQVEGELEIDAAPAVDLRDLGMSRGHLAMIRPTAKLHARARLSNNDQKRRSPSALRVRPPW